ncbi:DUF2934 domain-containing protein [Rhizobium sp. 11_C7_N12_5]|jgi:hypothetical protein|uniref:DUF2934 domain-containing protein n=1 Tax=Rhizobium sp. 11_C7_N12_5 TaxID=3240770 RepID=UPI003F1E84C8
MSMNESNPDLDTAASVSEPDNSTIDYGQDLHTRIKARAHQLWESEGRPDGREAEHWDQAQRELADEDGSGADPSRKAEIEHADAFKIAFGRA